MNQKERFGVDTPEDIALLKEDDLRAIKMKQIHVIKFLKSTSVATSDLPALSDSADEHQHSVPLPPASTSLQRVMVEHSDQRIVLAISAANGCKDFVHKVSQELDAAGYPISDPLFEYFDDQFNAWALLTDQSFLQQKELATQLKLRTQAPQKQVIYSKLSPSRAKVHAVQEQESGKSNYKSSQAEQTSVPKLSRSPSLTPAKWRASFTDSSCESPITKLRPGLGEPQWSRRQLSQADSAALSENFSETLSQAPFCGPVLSVVAVWSQHVKLIGYILLFVVYFETAMWFAAEVADWKFKRFALCFAYLPFMLTRYPLSMGVWMLAAPGHLNNETTMKWSSKAKRVTVCYTCVCTLILFTGLHGALTPMDQWRCGIEPGNELPTNCTEDSDCLTLESYAMFGEQVWEETLEGHYTNATNHTGPSVTAGGCKFFEKKHCWGLLGNSYVTVVASFAVFWVLDLAFIFMVLPVSNASCSLQSIFLILCVAKRQHLFREAPNLHWQRSRMLAGLVFLMTLTYLIMGQVGQYFISAGKAVPFCEEGESGCYDMSKIVPLMGQASAFLLFLIGVRIGIADTIVSFQNPIRHAFGYVVALVALIVYFPL
jgi:hypothetical protein